MSKKNKDMATSHSSSSEHHSRCEELNRKAYMLKDNLRHARHRLHGELSDPNSKIENIGILNDTIATLSQQLNGVRIDQRRTGCIPEEQEDQSPDLQTILTSASVRRKDRQALVEVDRKNK